MEGAVKRLLKSRKNESRSLFKKCFKTPMFSLVPFEIWRDLIVSNAETEDINRLCQTCWGFKELIDSLRNFYLEAALKLRVQGMIEEALKYLERCANLGNSVAMFRMGYSHLSGGFGLSACNDSALKWFKRAAECGNNAGMACYALCYKYTIGVKNNETLRNSWGSKALSGSDPFALGYCHYQGLGVAKDFDKAFEFFQASSNEGNEFGENWLANCFASGEGVGADNEKALFWYLRSAEKGLANSQYSAGRLYRNGQGCEKNNDLGIDWLKKASNQGHKYAKNALK